jgi:hypothetical protein
MAADHVAAEFVAELERALEIDMAPLAPAPERRDSEPAPRFSTATTVRQTPALAIEAPASIDAGS